MQIDAHAYSARASVDRSPLGRWAHRMAPELGRYAAAAAGRRLPPAGRSQWPAPITSPAPFLSLWGPRPSQTSCGPLTFASTAACRPACSVLRAAQMCMAMQLLFSMCMRSLCWHGQASRRALTVARIGHGPCTACSRMVHDTVPAWARTADQGISLIWLLWRCTWLCTRTPMHLATCMHACRKTVHMTCVRNATH